MNPPSAIDNSAALPNRVAPKNEAVELEAVRFGWDARQAPDLSIDTLQIAIGERLFVEGPSGGGKSTLLGLLAGVTVPQEGRVTILGETISEMGPARRDHFRADHIGYLFQMFNLIPYLTVTENVTLPLRFSERRRNRVSDPAAEAGRLLEHLGMGELLHRPVTKLSVGQQQRVAAARALIGAPEIILADEPTSSLDAGHSERFIELLFEECAQASSTLIFVSHDAALGRLFDRRVELGK
jgi:putative ABC transport system ATP-binding protein